MQRNLTQNHLVLLLTETISPEKKSTMLNEVHQDFLLNESYVELKKAYSSLVKIVKQPPTASVKNILNYSRQSWATAQA